MLLKIKHKTKSIFKRLFDVKRSKSFDLDAHLESLLFFKSFENDKFCVYEKGNLSIAINKESGKIRVIEDALTLSELNFIPESAIVLDMLVKLTLKNLK